MEKGNLAYSTILGGIPPGTNQGQSVLIIDGAYLSMGAREIEKQTNRKLNIYSEESIGTLIRFIRERTGGLPLTQRHLVTAEKDSQSIQQRQSTLYNSLKKNSISVDIRGFKKKQAWCPNKQCPHSQKAFDLQIQQEVDVAIVMKAMKIAFSNQLEQLVLIAGDGDFKDMVEFFTETLYKKVWIFGYRSSLSASLHEKASPGCVFFIDDIWEHISVGLQYSQQSQQQPITKQAVGTKFIEAPEIITEAVPTFQPQQFHESCEHREFQEEPSVQHSSDQDFKMLLKLGFDENIASEAISKHPGDTQSAIQWAIERRKQVKSSQV